MVRKWNALDWYHEKYCSCCDRPIEDCKEGSLKEVACILAALLRELATE